MQSKIFKEDHNPLSLFHDDDDDAPGKGWSLRDITSTQSVRPQELLCSLAGMLGPWEGHVSINILKT